MPIKEKIEVEMLSPLMAEFIPDYSDIVDLDDAEPLEGPDLVQYQPSIAEKVDEINRLGMPDNQPCNLIDYFDQNKDIKEKVERITMAVKEQEGGFIWLCKPDTPGESDTRGIPCGGAVSERAVQRWLGRKSGTAGDQGRRW